MQICFIVKKNSDLHLRKMQIYFILKKNSDLHLGKMHICFILKKNLDLHLGSVLFEEKIRSTFREDADLFLF